MIKIFVIIAVIICLLLLKSYFIFKMIKFFNFVLHFQELISQIRAQKKTVLTLNITGQKFISASPDAAKIASLKQRIKVTSF